MPRTRKEKVRISCVTVAAVVGGTCDHGRLPFVGQGRRCGGPGSRVAPRSELPAPDMAESAVA